MATQVSAREEGVAHIGIIIAVVVFVGLIGLIAWRVWDSQQKSSPTSSAVKEALANANCQGEDKDICKFLVSWKASSSYKVSSTMVSDGKTTSSTFESADSGKRFHMVTSMGDRPYEIITIDNTTYTKDASGTWWKKTIEPSKESEYKGSYNYDFTDPTEESNTQQKTTYKLIGREACGKLTCFKYQIIDPAATDQTEYIWFDTTDYQLRRMRSETKDGSSDQTFSYENATINVPSPVKELGQNQMLNPETGEVITMPSESDYQNLMNSVQ